MNYPLQNSFVSYNQISWDTVVTPPAGKQIHVYEATVRNESGGAIGMGILKRLSPDAFHVYSITAASSPDALLDDSVKSGSTFTAFTGTNNDGFMVGCSYKFGLVGVSINAASGGGTYALSYFNGTAFVAITGAVIPSMSSTGRVVFFFVPPHDWVPGTTATVGGDSSLYNLQIIATTHPTTPVTINDLIVAQPIDYTGASPAQGELKQGLFAYQPLMLGAKEGIQPYFSAAAVTNVVRVVYAIQP